MKRFRLPYSPWSWLLIIAIVFPVLMLVVAPRVDKRLQGLSAQAGALAGLNEPAPQSDHPVLAVYYPWYSPDSFGNAADQPARQPYQSDDPAMIREQVIMARTAGVNGFISAWFGQGDRTDQNFNTLLDIAQEEGFTATIYF